MDRAGGWKVPGRRPGVLRAGATEYPCAVEQEPERGRDQVGGDQYRHLRTPARRRRGRVQPGQRARGEREAGREGEQALELVPGRVRAPADAEGQPPVGGGVGHGRDEQAERVGGQGRHDVAQQQVQDDVGQRAGHADDAEPGDLPAQLAPSAGRAGLDGRLAQRRHLDGAAHEPAAQARDAAQVGEGRGRDVDPGVGVVDPVHRDLVDTQARPLAQYQQLGVEEPAGVLGQREQDLGLVPADRLEAALGVGELRAERGPQQQVVAARDDLPAGPADHPGAVREPGADRDVAVSRQQRGHQRQQRVQVGGQVHVHVGQDLGVAGRPDRAQRPAAPGLFHMNGGDAGQFPAQRRRDRPGPVGAAVIGNSDPRGERELLAQVGAEPPDAGG